MPNTNAQLDYMRSVPIRRLRHPLDDSAIWNILGSALASVITVALGLPVVILLFIILPVIYAIKWFLLLFYWNRRRSHYSQGGVESMRGNDCRWLGSAWKCSVLHAVLVFDSHIEVTMLRQLMLSRIVPLYPRLTRRPFKLPIFAGSGHCWLPDSNFHIDNHVFHGPTLKGSDTELQEYVSRLLGEGLSMDKPPWELHLLLESGTKSDSVAVLRVHQSVADGPALLKLLCHCLSDTRIMSRSRNCTRKSVGFYCNLIRGCLLGPVTLFLWFLLSSKDCNLFTQKTSWSGHMKVTWSATITLSKVNRVKLVTRSTTNCVLLAALAGALRLLLQNCGVRQPPDMRVVVPVNLRTQSESRDDTELGSRVAPVVVSLPVGVEGAIPRLWNTRKSLSTLRCSSDGIIVYLATAALMTLLPSHSARKVLSSITEEKASLQFSSLIGPSSTVLIGGCPLKSVYSLLPAQAGIGMAVSVLTYADQVFVAVATDSSLEPAGSMLLYHLKSQIELLYNLLKNRRVPGDGKADNSLYRFPDVTCSPMRELTSRLTIIQEQVQRLSSIESSIGETEKLQRLRAEFSHLLRELRKRKSIHEIEPWEHQFRSRRRAMSCSITRRPSLVVSARPVSVIETLNSSQQNLKKSYTLRPYSCIDTSSPSTSNCTKLDIELTKKLILKQTMSQPINPAQNSFKNCEFNKRDENVNMQSHHVLDIPSLSPSDIACTISEQKIPNGIKNKNLGISESNHYEMSNLGLYDEILSAIKDNKTLYSVYQNKKDSNFENKSQEKQILSDIQIHPIVMDIRLCDSCQKSNCRNLKRCPQLSDGHSYEDSVHTVGLELSRSNLLENNNDRIKTEYEVAIESLSNFATKIRRLSLENCLIVSPSQGTTSPRHSRRHSTIPEFQVITSASQTVLNMQSQLPLSSPYLHTSISESF